MMSHDITCIVLLYSLPLDLAILSGKESVIRDELTDHWQQDRLQLGGSRGSLADLVVVETHHLSTVCL